MTLVQQYTTMSCFHTKEPVLTKRSPRRRRHCRRRPISRSTQTSRRERDCTVSWQQPPRAKKEIESITISPKLKAVGSTLIRAIIKNLPFVLRERQTSTIEREKSFDLLVTEDPEYCHNQKSFTRDSLICSSLTWKIRRGGRKSRRTFQVEIVSRE